MQLTQIKNPNPLREDKHGVTRIGATRVTLQNIVHLYMQGASAEEIALRFDVLNLTDVYATLSFYLNHSKQVQQYLDQQHQASTHARRKAEQVLPTVQVRERLLQRKRKDE